MSQADTVTVPCGVHTLSPIQDPSSEPHLDGETLDKPMTSQQWVKNLNEFITPREVWVHCLGRSGVIFLALW